MNIQHYIHCSHSSGSEVT